jgi:hypothetical protein
MKPPTNLDEHRQKGKKPEKNEAEEAAPAVTAQVIYDNLGALIKAGNVKAAVIVIEDQQGEIQIGWTNGNINAIGLLNVGIDSVLDKLRGF